MPDLKNLLQKLGVIGKDVKELLLSKSEEVIVSGEEDHTIDECCNPLMFGIINTSPTTYKSYHQEKLKTGNCKTEERSISSIEDWCSSRVIAK